MLRASLALLGLLWAAVACAQAWPAKPVRIIVSTGPGLATDIMARLLNDRLSKNLGQQFVVENIAGAAGIVGAQAAAAGQQGVIGEVEATRWCRVRARGKAPENVLLRVDEEEPIIAPVGDQQSPRKRGSGGGRALRAPRHPERAVELGLGSADGLVIFRSLVTSLAAAESGTQRASGVTAAVPA